MTIFRCTACDMLSKYHYGFLEVYCLKLIIYLLQMVLLQDFEWKFSCLSVLYVYLITSLFDLVATF